MKSSKKRALRDCLWLLLFARIWLFGKEDDSSVNDDAVPASESNMDAIWNFIFFRILIECRLQGADYKDAGCGSKIFKLL